MSISKNLGGDRIGSGSKMDVTLSGFKQSSHNVTQITRTTQAVGTLVPIFTRLMLKGNRLDLDLNAMCFTNPTEGPCFGEYEVQMHVFSADLRLYQGKLHMNLLEQGTKMAEIKFPQIQFVAKKIDWTKDPNNQQINQSCIHQYLGTRGLGDALDPNLVNEVSRYREASKYLMLWDTYGNYYANQQEGVGFVVHNDRSGTGISVVQFFMQQGGFGEIYNIPEAPSGESFYLEDGDTITIDWAVNEPGAELPVGNVKMMKPDTTLVSLLSLYGNPTITDEGGGITRYVWNIDPTQGPYQGYVIDQQVPNGDLLPRLVSFPLDNLNQERMDLLADVKSSVPYVIDGTSRAPFGLSLKKYGDTWSKETPQEGLPIRTYKSDIFNNYLDSTAIDEINERSKVMIDEEGGFTMESFLLQEKLFDYLNRIQLMGNSVDDWEEAAYGIKNHRKPEKPIFHGGLTKRIKFDEVISQTPTDDKPLGTLAATGKMGNEHHGGKVTISSSEACYVMVLASIVPILDYTQGNDWTGDLETYEDLHKPSFDKIGFQNLPTDWMATWDTKISNTGAVTMYSAGKQPSWIHYQTNFNQDYGEFAKRSSEGWMVNGREYEANVATRRIKDLTTYIDPAKWNDIFAYKSRTAQNYRMQYLIEAKQRLIMSANQIPNL